MFRIVLFAAFATLVVARNAPAPSSSASFSSINAKNSEKMAESALGAPEPQSSTTLSRVFRLENVVSPPDAMPSELFHLAEATTEDQQEAAAIMQIADGNEELDTALEDVSVKSFVQKNRQQ